MKTTQIGLKIDIGNGQDIQRPSITVVDDPGFADPRYEGKIFTRLLREKWPHKRGVFLDVGAHQGIYASVFKRLAGPFGSVHAFEPNPINLSLLAQNAQPDVYDGPTAIYPFALGRCAGHDTLKCWHEGRLSASGIGGLVVGERPDYEVSVRVVPLDDLSFPGPITLIKIDVEHWEFEVLCGGLQTILRDRPRLLVECHDVGVRYCVERLFNAYGFAYEVWLGSRPLSGGSSEYLFARTGS